MDKDVTLSSVLYRSLVDIGQQEKKIKRREGSKQRQDNLGSQP